MKAPKRTKITEIVCDAQSMQKTLTSNGSKPETLREHLAIS